MKLFKSNDFTISEHVMPELITRYYETLDAPKGKKLYWSDKSSHVFHVDDARENEQRLIQHLQVSTP
ncbi:MULTISPECIES: hypothetical protein [unclassified Paenibacillus]|uniref:hypothetical protein n=1 Tax=unclassified Paenibacillus TaxID=185978 RepID=UPI001AE1B82A|nr:MULTISPECIES: hypothetical protein [unclassified Paenibacillus]MBP1153690.1 hypothetical protein [Paenibacillus sp. PvP091]MBP1170925.1 hypothetical protein [Paenibacillus sp. PvR098]MBP2441953.1 hypothetical protein [Paenibacillus sp. PvP052]